MGCVYCHQVGSSDCFKIGRTKNATSGQRLKSLSVGSSFRLHIYREIQTDYPTLLENLIHWILDAYRAENGEFFNVSMLQLDKAIEEAQAHLTKNLPTIQQAKKLQRVKTKPQMLEATDMTRTLHRELTEKLRQFFFLEQQIEVLKAQLMVAIGDNAGIAGIASWKWEERLKFNQQLFKREEPELFEKYKRPSGTRYFRPL